MYYTIDMENNIIMEYIKQIPTLAIVVPCYNEELCIKNTIEKLEILLDELISKNKIRNESYIYIIDDGSVDNTWQLVQDMNKTNKRVKGAKFIKNFGNQNALLAGLEKVNELGCDCVVTIDADLQQDENAIEKFVDEYMRGNELVLGVRNGRETDSFFKKMTALMFYQTMNFLGAKTTINHSDYRLMSKKALNILKMFPEKAFFLRGFVSEIGLKTSYVKFDVKRRAKGESKFTFASLMALALNGITSYSVVPLRIVAIIGVLMSLFSFLLGIEIVFEKIYFHNSPSGWATQVILLCAFGGIQLFCLGIIGEYIGQIYKEVKSRPRYIIDYELK